MQTTSLADAKARLSELDLEALVETLEVLSDPDAMATMRASEQSDAERTTGEEMAAARASCHRVPMVSARDLNQQLWETLKDHGVEPGSSLDVEIFFFSPTEDAATALADDLSAQGWTARPTSTTRGLFRKRVEWSVAGSRTVDAVELAGLDAMVDALEAIAAAHGSEFDGWGAEVGG